MWDSGGSGCEYSAAVGNGILICVGASFGSVGGRGMVGVGFGSILAQRLIFCGGFYGGGVEFGFGFEICGDLLV